MTKMKDASRDKLAEGIEADGHYYFAN